METIMPMVVRSRRIVEMRGKGGCEGMFTRISPCCSLFVCCLASAIVFYSSYSSITYSKVSMEMLRKMMSKAAIRPSQGGSLAEGKIKLLVARTEPMTTGTI